MYSVIIVLLLCSFSYGSEENLKKLVNANNNLALKLDKRLSAASTRNLFFSPLSISTAFGMLFYGAKGTTAEELRDVLGYKRAELSDDLVHSSFHDLLTNLESSNNSEYTINLANAILLDKKLDLVPTYKSSVKDIYKALVQDVDFAEGGEEIVDEVNDWVEKNTNGKIDDILDDLDASNVFLILNAVYFKGNWKTKFDHKGTFDQTFYNEGLTSSAVEVPTMHIKSEFPYLAQKDMQILELPYKEDHFSMFLFLPTQRDGLAEIEHNLTLNVISEIRNKLTSQEVRVALPKFKLEYSQELSSDFRALGAKSMFKAGVADFSGMTQDKSIVVSRILHKAVVKVNEKGSEAAGSTGILYGRTMSYDPEFRADHPFLFAIVDKRSDMILFVGRVNNL